MDGSTFSQGDQELQLWKSSRRGKILFGGALMLVLRWTRNESALVMAMARTAATRTTTTIPIILSIEPPKSCATRWAHLRDLYYIPFSSADGPYKPGTGTLSCLRYIVNCPR